MPGLVLLAGLVWGFVRLLRRERLGGAEVAVLAGVAALGLHNLFDFSLELPACAVAALVALATVARPEERETSRPERSTFPLLRERTGRAPRGRVRAERAELDVETAATRGLSLAAGLAVLALVAWCQAHGA